MIQPIGRGAYGEVWLARNVLRTYRAVKIVYRDRFEDSKPYEREFNGIKTYEPVSRAEAGLMDILQIGRNDEEGYFYYVMELADDALSASSDPKTDTDTSSSKVRKQEVDPHSYVPETLSRILHERSSLSAAESVAIGISLTRALGFLHENGLVHRDIKPSNIIFVSGIPKLADIGLLAEFSEAQTMVGTQGFIAPEGPNSPQGDIFSLGKVLYEASTGKDRQCFPEPKSQIDKQPDAEQLLELNVVVLKAAEHDSERRYASMKEMQSDLELIREGKSVRRNRKRQRRVALMGRLAGVSLLVAVVAGLGAFVARRNQEDATFEQMPADPILTQFAGPIDDTRLSEILPRNFDVSPDGKEIAITKSGGLEIWNQKSGITHNITIDRDGWNLWSARYSPDGLQIASTASKPQDPEKPDGDRFWTLFLMKPDGSGFQQLGEIFEFKIGLPFWTPDGLGVSVHSPKGRIDIHLNGSVVRRPEVPLTFLSRTSSYSPDGRWIATDRRTPGGSPELGRDIWILPSEGGQAIQLTHWDGVDTDPTWSADGQRIYYVSTEGSANNESWNIREIRVARDTGLPLAGSRQITRFVDSFAMFPKIVDGGKKLTFVTKGKLNVLWTAPEGKPEEAKPLVRCAAGIPSPQGDKVYFSGQSPGQKGLFQIPVSGGNPTKIIEGIGVNLARVQSNPSFAISPDGRTIVFSGFEGEQAAIYSVSSGGGVPVKLVDTSERDSIIPAFSPDGTEIAYADDSELFVMRKDGSERKELSSVYRWQPWSVRWSPDGKYISGLGYATPEDWDEAVSVFVVSRDGSETRRLTGTDEPDYKEGLCWHPDGARLTYMRYGPGEFGAETRWAYLDETPSQKFIDMPDRWDYTGRWAPDGERYFFTSFGEGRDLFVKRLSTGKISPAPDGVESTPLWSNDGKRMVWQTTKSQHQFWIMEGF